MVITSFNNRNGLITILLEWDGVQDCQKYIRRSFSEFPWEK